MPPVSTFIPVRFIDAFTTNGNSPFTGNPAAVCFLESDDDISDDTKQKIGNEANLCAAVFVSLGWENGKKLVTSCCKDEHVVIRRTIRWFTPTKELPLCGHGTVAAVKAIVEVMSQNNPTPFNPKDDVLIEFESKSRGNLGAIYNCRDGRITLNFPVSVSLPLYADGEKWIVQLIEATVFPELTVDSIQDIQYSPSARMMMLRMGDHLSDNDLKRINPDFARLLAVDNCEDMIAVIVTVKGSSNADVDKEVPHFYSRIFAPWIGVNEDQACGTAHTVLAPYWTREYFNGEVKYGKTLLGRQNSARGADLHCILKENDRVTLGGDARLVIKGELLLSE